MKIIYSSASGREHLKFATHHRRLFFVHLYICLFEHTTALHQHSFQSFGECFHNNIDIRLLKIAYEAKVFILVYIGCVSWLKQCISKDLI